MGTLLDEVLPAYDVHEVHDVWVRASPEDAYAAVRAVTGAEVRLFRPLMSLRTLGRSGRVFDQRRPLLDEMLKAGFVPLVEREGEIALGAVGRFWSLTGNKPVPTGDFAGFSRPGYAKAAMSFTVAAERDGSRITTETRIAGTDAAASRKFRAYWLVIRLGSGAIRRSWLKAIRRRLGS